MFDIKTLNISLDGETVARLKSGIKDLYYGTPRWLRRIVILSIIVGIGYFVYSRVRMSYDVNEVLDQIELLNRKLHQTIYSDQYLYDISNVVQTVRILQEMNDDQTRCVLQFLDILDECVSLHDPNSPTLLKISTLKSHIVLMSESNGNIIKHQVETYDKWLEQ